MPKPPPEDKKAAAVAKTPVGRPRPPFPKKNQAPQIPEFAARLPLAIGKRFESARTFLRKQAGVTEEVYFYGPRSGWGLRYTRGSHPLCALFIHGDRPVAIISLSAAALAKVAWSELSEVAQTTRETAHGSPSLVWLDLPLDGSGVNDLKALVRVKLATLAQVEVTSTRPPPPPARPRPVAIDDESLDAEVAETDDER